MPPRSTAASADRNGDARPFMVGELMPKTARITDKICVLRGMCTNDPAHSSSGYMTTGKPHQPVGVESEAGRERLALPGAVVAVAATAADCRPPLPCPSRPPTTAT